MIDFQENNTQGDRRKAKDVVTVRNSDESIRVESASVATNFDEDASMRTGANGSGVIFVTVTPDPRAIHRHHGHDTSRSSWSGR